MLAANTAAGVVQSASAAVATGRLTAFVRGKGTASALGIMEESLEVVTTTAEGTSAEATAVGTGELLKYNTKLYPGDSAYAVAKLYGHQETHVTLAGVSAASYAYTQGALQKDHISYGVAVGRALSAAAQYRTQLHSAYLKAQAFGLLGQFVYSLQTQQGIGQSIAHGQLEKTLMAEGIIHAYAFAEGRNQVNDAVKAPDWRTISLSEDIRQVTVVTESRIIVV